MCNISKILKDTIQYPNRKAYEVEVLCDDNTKINTEVLKAEGDLWLYMHCHIKPKLTEREYKTLQNLIDEFGFERYESGDLNNEID